MASPPPTPPSFPSRRMVNSKTAAADGLCEYRLWKETEGNLPALLSPALYPAPTGLQNVATSKWQCGEKLINEERNLGFQGIMRRLPRSMLSLHVSVVHRELSSGPCTENTTVIYQKEVNNVDYLFNYYYFYYCFPLVESTAVVRGGKVGTVCV